MVSSFRIALRRLAKSPGFTGTALVTLAICLAANLAIFAVVDAILLRSLPFGDSGRLTVVYNSYPRAGVARVGSSVPNYYERRNRIPAFSSMAIWANDAVVVGEAGSPNRVPIVRVSYEFFATLGVPMRLGRSFTEDQMAPHADDIAVITDGFWRRNFGADPQVIGRIFANDGVPVKVVGVLPPGFSFLSSPAQFYRPKAVAAPDRTARNRHNNSTNMIARLAPGATLADAQAQIDALNARLAADDPFASIAKAAGFHTSVAPLREDHVQSVKPALILLQCGGVMLLLIGGVNLTNLFLIRAGERTKELAVRQALGASRIHLAREVLLETFLLAIGGGLLGLLLGGLGIRLFAALGVNQLPLGASVTLDGAVAAASLAAAVVAGLLLAAPIIWFNGRMKLAAGLQSESRAGTAGPAAQRLRHGFIVAQVALAFVLLAGAGLLGLSLKRVLETPAGFNPESVFSAQLILPGSRYKTDGSRLGFAERLLSAVQALPGVSAAAINTGLPFTGGQNNNAITVEGQPTGPGAPSLRAHFIRRSMGDYWSLLGIPIRQGRRLEETDNRRRQQVCVVDQEVARLYWPGTSPIGRHLAVGATLTSDNAYTVVGVVGSVKEVDLAEAKTQGTVYVPWDGSSGNGFYLLVRSSVPEQMLAPMIHKTVLQLDPELPLGDVEPMQARIDTSLVARRSPAILAGTFAAVALLLAAIGTYGVLAYAVGRRRREIGVRMALGALPGQVLLQFFVMGSRLLGLGLAIGIAGAWMAGHAMRSLLFQVGPLPVAVLAGTTLVMAAVVFLAIFLPSSRAARVNPIEALRDG